MDHVIGQIEDIASVEECSELHGLLNTLREGHEKIAVPSEDPHSLADLLSGVFGIDIEVKDGYVFIQVLI